jgi:DNA/RNA-binding domain of Phe-tRNA-synthetase-like protein
MKLAIDDKIRCVIPKCRLGYSIIHNVRVGGTPSALTQEFLQLQNEVEKLYNLNILSSIPRILAVRSMYKKLEFDPSRYRPASEALVRRVLQKKGGYYINSAVDVNNYCSMKFLLPFGLYDLDHIHGDVHYRVAAQGQYINIAGNAVSTEGKPFLCDAQGVFGNPTSDSKRSAVTVSTQNLLSVVYADEEVDDADLQQILKFTADMMVRYNSGTVVKTQIVYA